MYPSQPLPNTDLPSVIADLLAFSRILHKRYHTVCRYFYLPSFTQHSYFKIHPCHYMYHSQLIPCFCRVLSHYVDTPHFVHSPVNWHSSCSQFGLIFKKLVRTFVHKSLDGNALSFISSTYLEVECQSNMLCVCLTL